MSAKTKQSDHQPPSSPVFDSKDLFGDQKLVLIRHNDDWYRLLITKQNKLILMK